MVSAHCFYFASVLWLSATISAQNSLLDTTNVAEHGESAATAAAATPKPLSPEKKADILMARKMYREAAETYKEAPLDSAVIQNKIGIAYHQMMQTDIARRYYERSIKIDPDYAEAI